MVTVRVWTMPGSRKLFPSGQQSRFYEREFTDEPTALRWAQNEVEKIGGAGMAHVSFYQRKG